MAEPTQTPGDLQKARQQREDRERAERAAEPEPGTDHDEQPDDDDELSAQLTITGEEELSHAIGGKKPDQSVIVFRGGEISILGPNGKPQQFKKGSRVAFLIEGPIREIHEVDRSDGKTGDVIGTKKKHVLKPDTVRRVPVGQAETLDFKADADKVA